MEVEEEEKKEPTTTKRKAGEGGDGEGVETDDDLVNFFGHFKIPTMFWGVWKKIENMGLVYLHRIANKPIAIVRRVNPNTGCVTGYNIYIQDAEDKEKGKVSKEELWLDIMGDTEEDRQLAICFKLDVIASQYMLEGIIESPEDAVRNCDEFLATLGLSLLPDRTTQSVKKRRNQRKK